MSRNDRADDSVSTKPERHVVDSKLSTESWREHDYQYVAPAITASVSDSVSSYSAGFVPPVRFGSPPSEGHTTLSRTSNDTLAVSPLGTASISNDGNSGIHRFDPRPISSEGVQHSNPNILRPPTDPPPAKWPRPSSNPIDPDKVPFLTDLLGGPKVTVVQPAPKDTLSPHVTLPRGETLVFPVEPKTYIAPPPFVQQPPVTAFNDGNGGTDTIKPIVVPFVDFGRVTEAPPINLDPGKKPPPNGLPPEDPSLIKPIDPIITGPRVTFPAPEPKVIDPIIQLPDGTNIRLPEPAPPTETNPWLTAIDSGNNGNNTGSGDKDKGVTTVVTDNGGNNGNADKDKVVVAPIVTDNGGNNGNGQGNNTGNGDKDKVVVAPIVTDNGGNNGNNGNNAGNGQKVVVDSGNNGNQQGNNTGSGDKDKVVVAPIITDKGTGTGTGTGSGDKVRVVTTDPIKAVVTTDKGAGVTVVVAKGTDSAVAKGTEAARIAMAVTDKNMVSVLPVRSEAKGVVITQAKAEVKPEVRAAVKAEVKVVQQDNISSTTKSQAFRVPLGERVAPLLPELKPAALKANAHVPAAVEASQIGRTITKTSLPATERQPVALKAPESFAANPKAIAALQHVVRQLKVDVPVLKNADLANVGRTLKTQAAIVESGRSGKAVQPIELKASLKQLPPTVETSKATKLAVSPVKLAGDATVRGDKFVIKEYTLQAGLAAKMVNVFKPEQKTREHKPQLEQKPQLDQKPQLEQKPQVRGEKLAPAKLEIGKLEVGGKHLQTGKQQPHKDNIAVAKAADAKSAVANAVRSLRLDQKPVELVMPARPLPVPSDGKSIAAVSDKLPQISALKLDKKNQPKEHENKPSRLDALIGAVAAASALARARSSQQNRKDGEESQDADSVLPDISIFGDDGEDVALMQGKRDITVPAFTVAERKARVSRPKYLVQPNDTLQSIAQDLLHDEQLAWLLLEINVGVIQHTWKDNVCVVELVGRQEIELPLGEEIVEFYKSRPAARYRDKRLVSSVRQTEIDRELVKDAFNRVIWRREESPAV